MNTRNISKINYLLIKWPPGTVATQTWLNDLKINRDLAKAYVRSGWIDRIGSGAYVRKGDKVEWPGAVHALQQQLDHPIHVGGKTALELQGYGHFLPLDKKNHPVWFFKKRGFWVPGWFRKNKWGQPIQLISANLFKQESESSLIDQQFERFSIKISSPERAIFEILDLVPTSQSYEEAKLLFESLTTLRPGLVQELLSQCRSIKAKRLFLFLADKLGHAWLNEINLNSIDLGKGKRVIVKGGHFNAKYGISVPDQLISEEAT